MRVTGKKSDVFENLEALCLPPEMVVETHVRPRKVRKRRKQFVQISWEWIEKLNGATGHTHQVALRLLYQNWKQKGGPVKLANGMLEYDGISRQSKWRALAELEQRGLVTVQRRNGKSPSVHLIGG